MTLGGHLADFGTGLGSGLGGIVGGIGSGVGTAVGSVTNDNPVVLVALGLVAYALFSKPAVPTAAGSTPLPATQPVTRQLTSVAHTTTT